MAAIADDVIDSFNDFVAGQRKTEGECVLTLVQFDSADPFELVADAVPLDDVDDLDRETFVPRGSTPLYDAMGRAILHTAERMTDAATSDCTFDVLFVAVTDGAENASMEFDRDELFSMIRRYQAAGWTFVFLGANQDAYAEGGRVGLAAGNTQQWSTDPPGTRTAFSSLDRATHRFRAKSPAARHRDRSDFFGMARDADTPDRDEG